MSKTTAFYTHTTDHAVSERSGAEIRDKMGNHDISMS